MIIVSQDREQIVNFDNIEIIFLKQREVWYQGIYGEGYLIAEYSTEERAKEVLQELVQTLCFKSKVDITSNGIDLSTEEIYYMSKE